MTQVTQFLQKQVNSRVLFLDLRDLARLLQNELTRAPPTTFWGREGWISEGSVLLNHDAVVSSPHPHPDPGWGWGGGV